METNQNAHVSQKDLMMLKTTNIFHINISEIYKHVSNSGDFCDMTLVSEDKLKVDAHKFFLASASAVFRKERKKCDIMSMVCL